LQSAMSTFQSALTTLTGAGKTLFAQSATLSDTTLGTGTASSSAVAGSYTFFVKQLATSHQTVYGGVPDNTPEGSAGMLDIYLGAGAGTLAFSVDLGAADTDGDHAISVREIAAAINKDTNNKSRVSAAVVNTAGGPQLLLSSTATGEASEVKLASGAIGALNGAGTVTVQGADAILKVGSEGSAVEVKQASNTFTNIDGVSMTFTKAQAPGATPLTVKVGRDDTATAKNVKDLVDAYNTLKKAIDDMTDAGDPSVGDYGGVFAHDAGIRALRDRLVDLMRPAGAGSLAAYGITAAKDGSLVIKESVLLKKLAADPTGLDTLIGSTASGAPAAISNRLNAFLTEWTDSKKGKIKQRDDDNDLKLKEVSKRQTRMQDQYDMLYKRYLLEFTKLQTLQSQFQSNSSMFDALFSSDKK
ncbi:MAG TPA: flagellar filament capping protein FliD, partial [Telluria sp.]|nr:flagellar filament capping protein FliD [Telluria sp.]